MEWTSRRIVISARFVGEEHQQRRKTGGNFQLTYTDTFGCRSDSAVAVPKDPRVYLWIFPTGCFKICPPEVLTVTGPVIRFNQWQYIRNGSAVHAGSNSVPTDYNTLTMDGIYNLFLDNGWCNVVSGNMYVEENCEGKPGRAADVLSMQHGNVLLELVPNPANDRVTVGYQFSPGSHNRWIEVYDVTGRLISKHEAPTASGKWELGLERFTSGIYNVMMRENGNVLLYGKLSIVK